MAIISDFDNFVFNSLRNEPLKQLVTEETSEELLPISFTTSVKATSFDKGGEASDVLDDNGEPVCMKIGFWRDRSCLNKLLYLVYKFFRYFFVSFYFYFYPPIAIFLTFELPMFFRTEYKQAWVEVGFAMNDPTLARPDASVLAKANLTPAEFNFIVSYNSK